MNTTIVIIPDDVVALALDPIAAKDVGDHRCVGEPTKPPKYDTEVT